MAHKIAIILSSAYFVLTQGLSGHDFLHPKCGLSSGEFNRVVGGQPATPGAWPWMAAIYNSPTGIPADDVFRCGGTLISERHVISAAHCFRISILIEYVVRLGIINKKEEEGVRIMVDKVIIHPNYSGIVRTSDVAILRLNEKVNFTDKIHPICLPLSPEIKYKNFTRTYPFIAGWGRTAFHGNSTNILMEAQVPVVSNSVCENNYKRSGETANFFLIDDRAICAGHSGVGTCHGDSGGPLMFPLKNIYYLIGVVSGSYRCAEPGFPDVFARVTSFLDFILDNMN